MRHGLLIALMLAACGGPEDVVEMTPPPTQPPPTQPPPTQPPPTMPPANGLPCDVQAALQANCAGCHSGAVYIPGFATRDQLLALGSKVTERMQSLDRPMPPSAARRQPTAEERAVITNWVAAGMPAGTCGGLK